jgi:anthranilate synthase component 1
MDYFPETADFKKSYEAKKAQVVWTTLVSDLDTPVSAFLKLAGEQANSFLLESVEGGAIRGRYSFIGLKPDVIWRCFGGHAQINRNALTNPNAFEDCSQSAIPSLKSLAEESCVDLPLGLPPMATGLVGYLAYDTVRLVENLPDANPDVLDVPDGIFLRPTIMAVFDTIEDTVTLITPARPLDGEGSAQAYDTAINRLAEAVVLMESSLPQQGDRVDHEMPDPVSNMKPSYFHEMVEKAKRYILAGDIFQVVLSQRFAVPFKLPPFSLYRALRRLNPSPFLFHLNFGAFCVVGSSPEILVRVRDKKVTIRPIAGTRPRGKTPEEDQALADELLADPKELAEHLMLLDLGRNDVGRVAKIGTVKVTDQMMIERYSHVMHIVSNIEGELDPEYDALKALLAGFPAGTVSGAPKVRAMEIIDELETEKRGIYAGCIGYFGANGDMDTCIALRTAIVKGGTVYVQAGGGIVADSDPEAEFQESCNKARALILAAQEAVRFASSRN